MTFDPARPGQALQCAFDFDANEVGLRQRGAAIDLAQPVRADEDEHDFGAVDAVGKTLWKEVTGMGVFNIEGQLVGIEPLRPAVMQPPGMAACARPSIADKDRCTHQTSINRGF